MPIPGNLLATAMAIMPHTDVDRALNTALSLDVPFWPQLPNYSYYEDMYVQASEQFLFSAMSGYEDRKAKKDMDMMLRHSLLSPATCCLINPDKEKTVEKAFVLIKELSQVLREKYRIV